MEAGSIPSINTNFDDSVENQVGYRTMDDSGNAAAEAFLGDGTANNPSHLEFETWYHPDVCHYLLHISANKAQCIRVLFLDASDDSNAKTFKDQVQTLVILSNLMNKNAIFIAKEPGAQNHFVCGLVHQGRLLLINPLGITTHHDCYRILAELKTEGILSEIRLSNQVLQRQGEAGDGDSLSSCGPISVELAIHILENTTEGQLNQFWSGLTSTEPTTHAATGLVYFGTTINLLLEKSETFRGLLSVTHAQDYRQKVLELRQKHFQRLSELPASWAKTTDCSVSDYLEKCQIEAPAQVVFNALLTQHRAAYEIEQLDEYQLLETELSRPLVHLKVRNQKVERAPNICEPPHVSWKHILGSGQPEEAILEAIQIAIKQGANIDQVDEDGQPALCVAMIQGYERVVRYLVENKADINQQNSSGLMVLNIAIQQNHLEMVQYLVDHGASIHSFGGDRRTSPVEQAAKGGFLDIVRYLAECGAEVEDAGSRVPALEMAVQAGQLAVVRYLVEEQGVDVNHFSHVERKPILHVAVKRGFLWIVQYLIAQQANVHQADTFGDTALHHAVSDQEYNTKELQLLAMVQCLVAGGADVNQENKCGITALYEAVIRNYLLIAQYLIGQGALVEPLHRVHSWLGGSALSIAAGRGYLEMVQYLVAQGFEFKTTNHGSEEGAIVQAAWNGHLEMVQYLVTEHRADVNQVDQNGRVALHCAAEGGDLKIVEYLISQGAEIQQTDEGGETALHAAVKAGHLLVVDYLVEHGVQVQQTNARGETALHVALQGYELKLIKLVVEYLVAHGADVNQANVDGVTPVWALAHGFHATKDAEILHTTLRYLVEQGAHPNQLANAAGKHVSLLQWAVAREDIGLVQFLVEHGALINQADQDGQTPLLVAVSHFKGDLSIIQYLVERGAIVNHANHLGNTAFLIASGAVYNATCNEILALFKYLIKQGADINQMDTQGKGALSVVMPYLRYSTEEKLFVLFEYLIEQGVNVNQMGTDEQTVLWDFVNSLCPWGGFYQANWSNNRKAILKSLIEHGADIHVLSKHGDTVLARMVKLSHLEMVRYLVKHGAQVKAGLSATAVQPYVAWAALMNHFEMVQYLVAQGADVNQVDEKGMTPVEYAVVRHHNLDMVKFLVEQGALLRRIDDHGPTKALLMHVMHRSDDSELFEYLVEHGVDVNQADEQGNVPIWAGLEQNSLNQDKLDQDRLERCQYLIAHGADVNQISQWTRQTLLHYFIRLGHLEMVECLVARGALIQQGDLSIAVYGMQGDAWEMVSYLLEQGAAVNPSQAGIETPLCVAVERGSLALVQYLVEQHQADVNQASAYGQTPLQAAVSTKNLALVQYLIGRGAQINVTDDHGWSALSVSVLSATDEAWEIVRYLVDNGADVNQADKAGTVPVWLALDRNQIAVSKYLISQGANVDQLGREGKTLLHYFASQGDLEMVQDLVGRGCAINQADNYGHTALGNALRGVQGEAWGMVSYLLEQGAAVNPSQKGIEAPLWIAVERGNLALVQYLVEYHQADVNQASTYGSTPLETAVSANNLALVRYLVSCGANVHQVNRWGKTLLHYFAREGDLAMVQHLVGTGCAINQADDDGHTALSSAVRGVQDEAWDVVRYLLEQGAEVNPSQQGIETSLCVAVERGNLALVQYLVEQHQADVNQASTYGRTPLQAAISAKNLALARYLIGHGADVNSVDSYGHTALSSAVRGVQDEAWDVVRYLLEQGAEVNPSQQGVETPLCVAVERGNLALVQYLVEQHHADVKEWVALTYAVVSVMRQTGSWEMVSYLIERGADVHLALRPCSSDGYPLLQQFVVYSRNQEEKLRYLIDHGADINQENAAGDNLLQFCMKRQRDIFFDFQNRENFYKYLIGCGSNISQDEVREASNLHDNFYKQNFKKLLNIASVLDQGISKIKNIKDLIIFLKQKFAINASDRLILVNRILSKIVGRPVFFEVFKQIFGIKTPEVLLEEFRRWYCNFQSSNVIFPIDPLEGFKLFVRDILKALEAKKQIKLARGMLFLYNKERCSLGFEDLTKDLLDKILTYVVRAAGDEHCRNPKANLFVCFMNGRSDRISQSEDAVISAERSRTVRP